MIAAVEQGYPQREIEQASYEFQKALERGERKFIGVNSFLEGGPAEIEPFAVDPAIERDQVAELRKRKAGRAGRAVEKALGALEQEAAGDGNVFPPILEAVKASATVGEICTTLARRFGRYKEPAARR